MNDVAKLVVFTIITIKGFNDNLRIKRKICVIKSQINHPLQVWQSPNASPTSTKDNGENPVVFASYNTPFSFVNTHAMIPTLLSVEENDSSTLHLYLPKAGRHHA